jgi:hypothetical protein
MRFKFRTYMIDKPSASQSTDQSHWLWVLCLIGLDYFSTLGYQPSIAYQAAGLLAPLATVVLVVVTLFVALPVYAHVAGQSPNGQGSIGLLERLVPGWTGKFLVLILLGFATMNIIFTRTFSAADAAVHLLHNPTPAWQRTLDFLSAAKEDARPVLANPIWQTIWDYWDKQMIATLVLLVLSFGFWWVVRRGFTRQAVRVSVGVVGVYLALNAVIIGSGLVYLAAHSHLLTTWYSNVLAGRWQTPGAPENAQHVPTIIWMCLLLFPKMALGLSGFEVSMVAMPLVRGDPGDDPARPQGRIRNTRKLLRTAALIMSVYLLGSALVATLLIPPSAFAGAAGDRALAYLAHGGAITGGAMADQINPLFGLVFGTVYDLSTIVILGLAGAAVTIALHNLVPPYLQRLGMELRWATAIGAIVHIFNIVKIVVTVLFHASVSGQRGAYATAVLALFTSASSAAALERHRSMRGGHRQRARTPWTYVLATLLFLTTAGAIITTRPEGIQFVLWSILAILVVSMISRVIRTTELRFEGFAFVDQQSQFLWESLIYLDFPVLVPHHPGHRSLERKEREIRRRHRLGPDIPIVFLEAQLGDPSEFFHLPLVDVKQHDGKFTVRITRCTSIPHAITAAALELSKGGPPPEIHFGWSNDRPFVANLNFVLFGQGNIPWMVRELIRMAEPQPEKQPRVFIG